jgi:hypothetical protein
MSRKQGKAQAKTAAALGSITNAATLLAALVTITADAARTLGTVPWGNMFHVISGGHFNKRGGGFIPAIIGAVTGDGSFDTLIAGMRTYAVPALRAEVQYAVATGDAAYFRSRKGGDWCAWALPVVKDGALDANASDDALLRAFIATCPVNRANVGGMLAEVTLTARKRNVTPLPVFADTVKTGALVYFDADTHGADGYQSKGYGNAVYTLTP